MNDDDDELELLRSAALQNAQSIAATRRRATRDMARTNEALERRTTELARSLAMIHATLEATTDGILVTDEHGGVTGLNQKYVQLWRLPPELVALRQHQPMQDHVASCLREPERYRRRLAEIYAAWPEETWDLWEDAEGRVIELFTKLQRIDQQPVGRVWSFRDVTERRRAEAEILRQREWFQVTLASIGDAVIATDVAGRISFLNPVAEAMTGWTNTEAAGRALEEVFTIINEHTRAVTPNPVAKVLREGAVVGLANHTALISRDGREIAIEDSAAPIRNADGAIAGAVMVFHDVTGRRRAEEALAASHAQFKAMLDHSPVGVLLFDTQLRLRHINARAEPVLATVAQPLGRTLEEILRTQWSGEIAEQLLRIFRHTLDTGEAYSSRTFSGVRADSGAEESYEWELHRVQLPDGKPGLVCYFNDISAHVRAQRALQESEERLSAIVSQAAVGIATAGLDGRFEQVNERFCQILGYSAEEIVTVGFRELTHPDDLAATEANVRRLIAGEIRDYAMEKRYRRKDGSVVWSLTSVAAMRDPAGRPYRFVGIIEDITQRKAAEAFVRESAERLKLALDAGQLGDWTWTVATDRVSLSPRAAEIFGLPHDEPLTWSSLRERLHHDDREAARSAVETAIANRSLYDIEYRVHHVSGELRWIAARGRGIYDEERQVVGMAGVVQDVTQRKRETEALREEYLATEQLNKIAQALATELELPKIVQIITDAGTKVTGAQFGAFFYNQQNQRGESYMLYTLSGAPLEAFARFPVPRATGMFGPTFRGEGVIRLDDVRQDPRFGHNPPYAGMPPGHLPVVSYLAVPVISRTGTVIGGLFFGHGEPGMFTARHEKIVVGIAAQAAAAMDTARVHEAEQRARAAAEQANETKDMFLAALSHELRTPLTPVLAILSSLQEQRTLPADVMHDLATARRNVELEARLIDDLLDLTRITRGKLELQRERVAVGPLVENAITTCAPEIAAKHLQLVRDYHAVDTLLWVDGARITQVLWNLLKNAVKFTPAGGTITIATGLRPSVAGRAEMFIAIADTGLGIEPEKLPGMFAAFEQGGREITRQFGGLGLGLAISQGLAEAHDGSISAASEGKGKGSTFTLVLPVQAAEPTASFDERTSARAPAVEPSTAVSERSEEARRTVRVLLVEDHADTAHILTRVLGRAGYEVEHASTVAAALDLAARAAQSDGFQLVVSDLGLPDQSGLELMRELSARYGLRGIALSGFGTDQDVAQSKAAGFALHLTKPVDAGALRRALAKLLAK